MVCLLKKRSTNSVPESEIKNQILDFLKLKKYFHKRLYLGPVIYNGGCRAKNPLAGMPDIIGVFHSGRMFAIEIKADKGILSEEQEMVIKEMRENNVVAFVARTLDDVIIEFSKHQ
jgi:hypothetical protein